MSDEVQNTEPISLATSKEFRNFFCDEVVTELKCKEFEAPVKMHNFDVKVNKVAVIRDCYFSQELVLQKVQASHLELVFERCVFHGPVFLGNGPKERVWKSHFGGIRFEGCLFEREVYLSGSTVEKDVSFVGCEKAVSLIMEGSIINGDLHLFQVCFSGDLVWNNAYIGNHVKCEEVECQKWISRRVEIGTAPKEQGVDKSKMDTFKKFHCRGAADLTNARFSHNVMFERTTFHGESTFASCKFDGIAEFGEKDIDKTTTEDDDREDQNLASLFLGDTTFENARFGHADFSECEFRGRADFSKCKFLRADGVSGRHDFRNTKFFGEALFKGISLARGINFEEHSTRKKRSRRGTKFEKHTIFGFYPTTDADNKLTVEMKWAQFLGGVTFETGSRIRLRLRYTHLQDPTFKGTFETIHLNNARIVRTERTDAPTFEACTARLIRLHQAKVQGAVFNFSKLDQYCEFYARGAVFTDCTFKGEFFGWLGLNECELSDCRFHDLTLTDDIELSRSTIVNAVDAPSFFSNVRFSRKITDDPIKLDLSQSARLDGLCFDGCALDVLDLRGSILSNIRMSDGECKQLLLRRGLINERIKLTCHPSAQRVLEKGGGLEARQHELNDELNRHFSDGWRRDQVYHISIDFNDVVAQQPLESAFLPVHLREQAEEEESTNHAILEESVPSDAVEEIVENVLEADHHIHEFQLLCIGKDSEFEDDEGKEDPHRRGHAIDISLHSGSLSKFIIRQLKRFFSSAVLQNLLLKDFVIESGDGGETPNTKPSFRDLRLEGATIKSNVLLCCEFEGTFHADAASTFDSADFSKSRFQEHAIFADSTINGQLKLPDVHFEAGVTFSDLNLFGEIDLSKTRFDGPVSLLYNDVHSGGNWSFAGSIFSASVRIEGEGKKRKEPHSFLNFHGAVFQAPLLIGADSYVRKIALIDCDCNEQVTIRDINCAEDVELSGTLFSHSLVLKSICAEGALKATESHERGSAPKQSTTRCKGPVTLSELSFAGGVDLQGAIFGGSFELEATKVGTPGCIQKLDLRRCKFYHVVVLRGASIDAFVNISKAEFHGPVALRGLKVGEQIYADDTIFSDRLLIEDADRAAAILFARSTFYGPVVVRGSYSSDVLEATSELTPGASKRGQRSLHELSFSHSRFAQPVQIEKLHIEQALNLQESHFAQDLTVSELSFSQRVGKGLTVEGCVVHQTLSLRDINECIVSFSNVTVLGELDLRSFSEEQPLTCRLGGATLTNISLPTAPCSSLPFPLFVVSTAEHESEPAAIVEQQLAHFKDKSAHFSQIYKACEKNQQQQDALDAQHCHKTTLREIDFGNRLDYFYEAETNEQQITGTRALASRISAAWEALKIQFGKPYDNYGTMPMKILFWIFCVGLLSGIYFLEPGFGFKAVATAFADTILTPLGVFIPAMGVKPFGTKFASVFLQYFFVLHTSLVGLMLFSFLVQVLPKQLKKGGLTTFLKKQGKQFSHTEQQGKL